MLKLIVVVLMVAIGMSHATFQGLVSQRLDVASRDYAHVCYVNQPGMEKCTETIKMCSHDITNCYDERTCEACVTSSILGNAPVCGPCCKEIFRSEQFPTGTYNRDFSECDSEDEDSNKVKFCAFYCKSRGFRNGRCMPKSHRCYCSWTSLVEESFQEILSNEQSGALLQLIGSEADEWELAYDTRDLSRVQAGFSNKAFHDAVQDAKDTLTIVHVANGDKNNFYFGGFTSQTWDGNNVAKKDDKAYIFSLANTQHVPRLLPIKRNADAIYCNPNFGPSFGIIDNFDFSINVDVASGKLGQSLFLGNSYRAEMFQVGSTAAHNYLAGAPHFNVKQVTVYKKKTTTAN